MNRREENINYLDFSPVSAYDYILVVNVDCHSSHVGNSPVTTMVILGGYNEGRKVFVWFTDCCHNVGAGTLGGRQKFEHKL